MKKYFLVLIILLIFFFIWTLPADQVRPRLLPGDFEERTISHIKELVKYGPRPAGSKNEMKAAEYIADQFREIGLKTTVETFEYQSFEFFSLDLEIKNHHYQPVGLGYTPYHNINTYEGYAVLIDPGDPSPITNPENTNGKTIISNNFADHFQLLKYRPKRIIYVNSDDFIKIKSSGSQSYRLEISGEYKKFKSPNVIAHLENKSATDKEIIIGAHLDSYRDSPGANDNGSGVAVLIELARFFQKNKPIGTIRFITFGAEELGILGSRRYVKKHRDSLGKCTLYFNIDNVGGSGTGAIESLGGVSKLPPVFDDRLSKTLAVQPWEGIHSYWRGLPEPYIMGFLTTVNHPDWLVKNIRDSMKESGYHLKQVTNMGADQMSFARVGIVTTSIGIMGDGTHTPKDDLDKVNPPSMRKAADVVVRVVSKTLNNLE